jgi:uncharacterized protein (TIGR03435 family)
MVISTVGFAQRANNLAFEVASIRPAAPQNPDGVFTGMRGGPGTQDPIRVSYINLTLMDLVTEAYNIKPYQVTGPSWLSGNSFDIKANIPKDTTREELRLMMQSLLADRFQVKLHHETRDFPGYELRVAKDGSRLKLANDQEPLPPSGGMTMYTHDGQARLTAVKQTVATLINVIGHELNNPVIDKTGLTGMYDFVLSFTHEATLLKAPSTNSSGGNDTSLSTALQDQLGLNVIKAKVALDVIVVDGATKSPTEN